MYIYYETMKQTVSHSNSWLSPGYHIWLVFSIAGQSSAILVVAMMFSWLVYELVGIWKNVVLFSFM